MKKLTRSAALIALVSITIHCGKENFHGQTREGATILPPSVNGGGPNDKPVDPSDGSKNPNDPTVPSSGGNIPGGNPNNPNSGGDGINQTDGQGVEKLFELTCDTGEDGSRPLVDFAEKRDVKIVARVKGEFCPKAQRILNVMFIVDWSGSMGRHKKPGTGLEVAGNDPQIGGTCGRLKGAQQVINAIKAQQKPTDQVFITMMPFAGGAIAKRAVKPVALPQFESQMNAQTFCSYVVQDSSYGYHPQNPGGIDGAAEAMVDLDQGYSATNYKAAFDSSAAILKGAGGRKVVYFISDGEPTAGGSRLVSSEKAGIAAAKRFRDQVDNLTFNALLLGHDGAGAEKLLQEVAGSAARVRLAEDAQALATQILQFPDSVAIDENSGSAQVRVAPFASKALGLKYLKKDAIRDARWVFETQPFILLGVPGLPINNEVTVKATGNDGSTHQSFITIRYTQK